MLQLEHLNLVVKDIDASVEFYRTAFPHWRIRGQGTGEWYGKARRWLHFGDDYQYLTFNDDGEEPIRDGAGHQVGVSHFAYVTDDLAGIRKRLLEAGYQIHSEGNPTDYRQNVYFVDPAGFEVEFVQYYSDQPQLRNQYSQ